MILPQDILVTMENYIRFLVYLYKQKNFTIEELGSKFNISMWTLYKHFPQWEKEDIIKKIATTSTTAKGKRYQYQLTESTRTKLKTFLKMLIEGLGFKDMLLENIKEFDTTLTQTQENALILAVEKVLKEI